MRGQHRAGHNANKSLKKRMKGERERAENRRSDTGLRGGGGREQQHRCSTQRKEIWVLSGLMDER